MSSGTIDVLIIGGGISGLVCARHLQRRGIEYLLVEGDERVGGRIKTDLKDGFLLDHGFQVLQTAYPAAQEELDYSALKLQPFVSGAKIRIKDRFYTVSDPRKQPADLFKTLMAPIGSLADRIKLARLSREVMKTGAERLFDQYEQDSLSYLREYGFTPTMIERFFQPFFGGTCLDYNLPASSRVFRYLLKMFSAGVAAIPEKGMGEIPLQIAADLPNEKIRTGTPVTEIERGRVRFADDSTTKARAIVIATDQYQARKLLKQESEARPPVAETTFYFAANTTDEHTPYLVLNGTKQGIINNLAFPSAVSACYAPNGKSLISAVVLGQQGSGDELRDQVQQELQDWYGPAVKDWDHLATYYIPHALPDQSPPTANPFSSEILVRDTIFVSGELNNLPAIQWSLLSGKRTANAVIDYLKTAHQI